MSRTLQRMGWAVWSSLDPRVPRKAAGKRGGDRGQDAHLGKARAGGGGENPTPSWVEGQTQGLLPGSPKAARGTPRPHLRPPRASAPLPLPILTAAALPPASPVLARVRPAVPGPGRVFAPRLGEAPHLGAVVDPLGAEATEAGHVGVAGQEAAVGRSHGPAQDVRDAVGGPGR